MFKSRTSHGDNKMRGDKRKTRRYRLRHNAWLMTEGGQRCECVVTDISDKGAHINIPDSDAVPDTFMLLLAENGSTRRRCRVIWSKPREIGVKFAYWLDERSRAVAGLKSAAPNEPKAAEKV